MHNECAGLRVGRQRDPDTNTINTVLLGNKALCGCLEDNNEKSFENLNFTGKTEHAHRRMNYIMKDNIWQGSYKWERE